MVGSRRPARLGHRVLGEPRTAAALPVWCQGWVPACRGSPTRVPCLPRLVLHPVFSEVKRRPESLCSCAVASATLLISPAVSDLCALPCPDLGLGPLKAPKDADEGGRAASGSARKGRRQHSSPQNALLDCSLCGKVFSSASSLSKHYLTHSQERKHVCKVCSKAFKRQDHLYVGVWSPNGSSGAEGVGLLGLFHPLPGHLVPPTIGSSHRPVPQVAVTCA